MFVANGLVEKRGQLSNKSGLFVWHSSNFLTLARATQLFFLNNVLSGPCGHLGRSAVKSSAYRTASGENYLIALQAATWFITPPFYQTMAFHILPPT
jgi:hypothetical protein